LDDDALDAEDRAELAQIVIDINMAQANRDKKRLDELSDELLELLFDLESEEE